MHACTFAVCLYVCTQVHIKMRTYVRRSNMYIQRGEKERRGRGGGIERERERSVHHTFALQTFILDRQPPRRAGGALQNSSPAPRQPLSAVLGTTLAFVRPPTVARGRQEALLGRILELSSLQQDRPESPYYLYPCRMPSWAAGPSDIGRTQIPQ